MELIIITGLSGAGKSKAVNALEDMGYYCVDNMPPKLIVSFFELYQRARGKVEKVAIVVDARGGDMFQDLFTGLGQLRANGCDYKILFLDCKDSVIITRYKETRRRHPLMEGEIQTVEEAIRAERELLARAREMADYVVDTTLLTSAQLKEKVSAIFLNNVGEQLLVTCMSFGFKHGLPSDADLVFDVRCLPNPFYVEELRPKTGLDREVQDYIFRFPESGQFREKLFEMMDFLIPLYIREGKSQLVVAMGCTGGKHRSVAYASLLAEHLEGMGVGVVTTHRDMKKAGT
ncbi:MAG: RNase adapter RapZ [Oscillospiraceae bacterium]|nr:RNase adapter RapZ [Oscillospiraceae bacterium]MDY4192683.1 RNase adapter RapZ [Oscillospiraceae bacterium]